MEREENIRKNKAVKDNFINNLKMKHKLMFMSAISFILTLVVGIVGITQFLTIYDSTEYMEDQSILLLTDAVSLSRQLTRLRANLYISLSYGQDGNVLRRDVALEESMESLNELQLAMDLFYNRVYEMGLPKENLNELEALMVEFEVYVKMYDLVFPAIANGEYRVALDILDDNVDEINTTVGLLDSTIGRTVNLVTNSVKDINESVYAGLIILLVLLLLIFLVNIVLIMVITGTIDKSIRNVLNNIKYLKNGQFDKIVSSNTRDEIGQINRDITEVSEVIGELVDDVLVANKSYIDGSLNISVDSEKYNGGYAELSETVNSIFNSVFEKIEKLIVTINEIANGKFDGERFEFEGEQKAISDGLFACVDSITEISSKIAELTENANAGVLETVNTDEFDNSWKGILEELNKLVITIGEPINEVNAVISDMSNGKLSTKIIGDYQGIFNDLKNNVNVSVDSVNNAIIETKESLNKISNNDINFKLENNARGDFGEIQIAINSIVDRLNDVFEEFQSSSNDVLEVANQLSTSSQKIANGATEQASTIEELNATVEVINANTSENAKKAVSASEIANKSRDNAVRGDDEMKTMLKSMEEIKVASDNIANIIKVIDDIAFQTNLLALNASVEAARAGQHGKGFAVVAEEVRTLAGRSKEAANQTTELINESLQKVSLGNELANSTAKALHEIVTNIADVSELLEDISDSSSEQATSISEILTNLSTFEIVVQNNTNEAEESAESSRHLSEQSSILKGLIDEFRLLDR